MLCGYSPARYTRFDKQRYIGARKCRRKKYELWLEGF
jgi:hypothetical protein